jgi:hypothetical protein
MKVNIGFSTTNTWISRIIRWFMKTNISHSYVRIHDDTFGVDLVLHADWPGVVIWPAQKFDKENVAIEEYEIDDIRLQASVRTNMRLIGKKYDFLNLIGWMPVIIFKDWFKRKIRNPLDDPKRLICVDFCLHITNDAGITSLPYNVLNPKELRQWYQDNYEKNGWNRKVLYEAHTIVDNVMKVLGTELLHDKDEKKGQ